MPRSAKGSRRERELLDKLAKEGWIAHRIAGSGAGAEAICDLIAINDRGKPHFIEVKSRKSIYYPKQHTGQLELLRSVAKKCKAKPILAVKLNYKDWEWIDISRKIPNRVPGKA